ncbi:MAG: hypothetical protein ACJ72E_10460, partial [Marmoricola sp.]
MSETFTQQPVVVLGLTLAGALLLGWVTRTAVTLTARISGRRFLRRLHDRCGLAWQVTVVVVAELAAVGGAGLPGGVERPVRHALVIATIASVSWLV